MRIQFDYGWHTDDKTVIRYAARDNWTWKDYHAAVRVSIYAIQTQPHTVHTLIDFTTGDRPKFPSGVAAHARTFGKKLVANLSGNAVVVGVPAEARAQIGVSAAGEMHTADGVIIFVDSPDEALPHLEQWHDE
jgi:hypothetical protein